MRPYILEFAETMNAKMNEKRKKEGWDDVDEQEATERTISFFFNRLLEEVKELRDELNHFETLNFENIMKEAADVGNFAMFIHKKAAELRNGAKD